MVLSLTPGCISRLALKLLTDYSLKALATCTVFFIQPIWHYLMMLFSRSHPQWPETTLFLQSELISSQNLLQLHS